MKKAIFTLAAIISLVTVSAQSTWKVDNAHSSINFSISHFMISEVTGNFGKFDIEAKANEKFESPTFSVTIYASSINTNNEDRDDHLRSEDFFNVENNPNITFKSASYEQIDDKKFNVTGNITINGKTEVVTFNGNLNGIIKDDDGLKAGLKLTTTIARENFNLGERMSPLGKEVEIVINLEMNLE